MVSLSTCFEVHWIAEFGFRVSAMSKDRQVLEYHATAESRQLNPQLKQTTSSSLKLAPEPKPDRQNSGLMRMRKPELRAQIPKLQKPKSKSKFLFPKAPYEVQKHGMFLHQTEYTHRTRLDTNTHTKLRRIETIQNSISGL